MTRTSLFPFAAFAVFALAVVLIATIFGMPPEAAMFFALGGLMALMGTVAAIAFSVSGVATFVTWCRELRAKPTPRTIDGSEAAAGLAGALAVAGIAVALTVWGVNTANATEEEFAEPYAIQLHQPSVFTVQDEAIHILGFVPATATFDPYTESVLVPLGEETVEMARYLADEAGVLERCADLGYTCRLDVLGSGSYFVMLTDAFAFPEGGAA